MTKIYAYLKGKLLNTAEISYLPDLAWIEPFRERKRGAWEKGVTKVSSTPSAAMLCWQKFFRNMQERSELGSRHMSADYFHEMEFPDHSKLKVQSTLTEPGGRAGVLEIRITPQDAAGKEIELREKVPADMREVWGAISKGINGVVNASARYDSTHGAGTDNFPSAMEFEHNERGAAALNLEDRVGTFLGGLTGGTAEPPARFVRIEIDRAAEERDRLATRMFNMVAALPPTESALVIELMNTKLATARNAAASS